MRYILIIVTIFYYFHLNGQIKLLKCSFGACNHGYSDEEYKSCPKFTKVDFIDPTLTLELKNFSNCVGIYNPKVVVYGPIINLRFDEFKLDSINTFNEKKNQHRFLLNVFVVLRQNGIYKVLTLPKTIFF